MSKLWMYHANCPKGEIVNLSQAEQLEQDGWVKSPALLDLPKEDSAAKMDAEQIERARPEDLVGLVKTMGFKVMSEIKFESEMTKAKLSKPALYNMPMLSIRTFDFPVPISIKNPYASLLPAWSIAVRWWSYGFVLNL